MNIVDWLKANEDKFEVFDNASTPFIDYMPKRPLLFRGKPVEQVFIKLREGKDPLAYHEDGHKISSNKAEKEFTWK